MMPLLLAAGSAPSFFAEIAALIVAGAAIAYASYRLGLMPIVGFLIAGVVIGPNALGLVRDQALVDAAAEVGVILLLFTIGIEFSLEKLARIKGLIFGGGGLQVALTTLAVMMLLLAFGVPWPVGIFTGFLVALSSTAIVLKILNDRGETSSLPGQAGLGLLIFQDLAIIVMVMLVPVLGGEGSALGDVALALGKAAALIALVLLVARRVMPGVLEAVARTCSPEIFLLSVVAICFGTAYLTSLAGVSLSLGAFLAGLVVSESRFREHAFVEILPLQILFSATFFISVGMLLDVHFLMQNLLLVLAVVAAVLVLKVLVTGMSIMALGYRLPVAAAVGLLLAQVGEFSFVLERVGRDVGLFPAGLAEAGSQAFIASTVLLMAVTPVLAQAGTGLARRLAVQQAETAQAVTDPEAEEPVDLEDHVIVAGYGQAARRLVKALAGSRVPFVITTLSPGGASEAEAEGLPVLRGDASKPHFLARAGIDRARAVVIADDEPAMAQRIAAVARTANPSVRILVRTRAAGSAGALYEAGADHVISEELESIVQLVGGVLRDYEVAPEVIEAHVTAVRAHQEAVPHAAVRGDGAVEEKTVDTPGRRQAMSSIDTEGIVELRPKVDGTACSHLEQIRPVLPSAKGCGECLQTGDSWVHLRICMTCGHVGCCDASKNKHATKHFHRTRHPIMRSLEPGESWGWCYEDRVML